MAGQSTKGSVELIEDPTETEPDRLPTIATRPGSAAKVQRKTNRAKDALPDENWHVRKRQEDARARIAYAFVGGYLLLLLANIMVPVVLFLSASVKHPFGASDMTSLTGQISAAVSSLLGVLGVVLGYYFKATTDERRAKALRKSGES